MPRGWKKMFATLILNDSTEEQAMALKLRHFPRRLFRFGRFDENGFWEGPLLRHRLWPSSPRRFNDPFDCALVMDDTIVEAPSFREGVYQYLKKFLPECYAIAQTKQFDEVRDLLRFFIRYVEENCPGDVGPPDREAALDDIIENMVSGFHQVPVGGVKVLCFSERCDSSTMWGHYADHHRGFCISYDFLADPRQRARGKGIPLYPHLWPVIYQDRRVEFGELYKQGKLLSVTGAALFKSPEWSYEKEWRLVWSDYFDEHGVDVKDGGCMRAIYLGAKADMAGEPVKRVLRHASRRGIPVYKMEMSGDTYALIAVPVSLPGG